MTTLADLLTAGREITSLATNDYFLAHDTSDATTDADKVVQISTLSAYLAALTQTLTNKTLTTPTIASFTNATHDHSNAAGGGTLSGYLAATGATTGATSQVQVFTNGVSAPGAGTNSQRFGSGATAAGQEAFAGGYIAQAANNFSIAVGGDARATANTNIAIGYASRVSGSSGTGMGYAVSVTGSNGVAIGNSASLPASSGVAIGQGTSIATTESNAVVVGKGATITAGATGGGENTAIGATANAAEFRATALGYGAVASGISSTAIGRRALSAFTHAIAIGRGAWTNADNQVAIGYSGGNNQTDVFFESGHTHKYVDQDGTTITRVPASTPVVIHGFDAYDATGTPTNNVAGGTLYLAAGRSTGTAAGGSVIIQTAPAGGSSNNTKNALVDRLTVLQNGMVGVGVSPTYTLDVSGGQNAFRFVSSTNMDAVLKCAASSQSYVVLQQNTTDIMRFGFSTAGLAEFKNLKSNSRIAFITSGGTEIMSTTEALYAGVGFGVTAATARVDIAGSQTSGASLRIRSGTAPTTPNAGDMWFDGTNLKFYDGAATRTITWT